MGPHLNDCVAGTKADYRVLTWQKQAVLRQAMRTSSRHPGAIEAHVGIDERLKLC